MDRQGSVRHSEELGEGETFKEHSGTVALFGENVPCGWLAELALRGARSRGARSEAEAEREARRGAARPSRQRARRGRVTRGVGALNRKGSST